MQPTRSADQLSCTFQLGWATWALGIGTRGPEGPTDCAYTGTNIQHSSLVKQASKYINIGLFALSYHNQETKFLDLFLVLYTTIKF